MSTKSQCPIEIGESWNEVLDGEFQKPYFSELISFVRKEYSEQTVFPPKELIFSALKKTPFDRVKVVIMGQDPYHGEGQAHGLSFSVQKGIAIPPSLRNIFKELKNDLGIEPPEDGSLVPWADQGVLLLNAILTVREGKPLSHQGKGWERFTDAVIAKLCEREDPVIFVLWGKSAQEKYEHIKSCQEAKQHYVLKAPHPSPLSARTGFFGSGHFSKINEILQNQNKNQIDWNLLNFE